MNTSFENYSNFILLFMGNNVCCQETILRTNQFQQPTHHVLQSHHNSQKPLQSPNINQSEVHPQADPTHLPEPEPRNESKNKAQHHQPLDNHHKEEVINVPQLPEEVTKILKAKRFFKQEEQEQKNQRNRRYGEDVYIGNLDKNGLRPQGFGKMYKQGKGLYIGHFLNGRANGKGAYIFQDGSYYYGDFENNQAVGQNGQFRSREIQYRGGFRDNVFHGEGIEEGIAQTKYTFHGVFVNGCRKKGELSWNNGKFTNIYNGQFNSKNQFHGQGILKQLQGTYKGDFVNGIKQGTGTYDFSNGKRYHGDYSKGQRSGQGTIYLQSGIIEYKGQMNKGLPHGEGFIMVNGNQVSTTWVHGIDVNMMPQSH